MTNSRKHVCARCNDPIGKDDVWYGRIDGELKEICARCWSAGQSAAPSLDAGERERND